MSGLVKAKNYDWKDSNLALFGSDTEKQVKKDSAKTEPAWKGAGQKPGLQIWRIKKFKVTHEQKEDYGKFYNGDSYIILNTYKKPDSDELLHDVHFWIGKQSTQDEYGTAAYKTVELDTFLDDKPVQHREVQGHESEMFKSYFTNLTILEGGCDSGFRHVAPETYETRLLKLHGEKKRITVKEIPAYQESLTDDDVFIIDCGLEIIQFHGEKCNKDEKFKAVQYVQQLRVILVRRRLTVMSSWSLQADRFGKAKQRNCDKVGACAKLKEGAPPACEEDPDDCDTFEPVLWRLSDEGGSLDMSVVSKGRIEKDQLRSEDVFIADTGKEVFVWIGKHASEGEKKNGMSYATNYLKGTQHPLVAVTVLEEGKRSQAFELILH